MEQVWVGMEKIVNTEGKKVYRVIDKNGKTIADVYDEDNANMIMHAPDLGVYLALIMLVIGTNKTLDKFFSRFDFFNNALKLFEELAKTIEPQKMKMMKDILSKYDGASGDLFVNNN